MIDALEITVKQLLWDKRNRELILASERKKFYVVTARDADKAERHLYRERLATTYEKTI